MDQIKTWQQRQAETGIGSLEAKDDEIRELRQSFKKKQAVMAYRLIGHSTSDNGLVLGEWANGKLSEDVLLLVRKHGYWKVEPAYIYPIMVL